MGVLKLTNYFKVYLTSKNGRQCVIAKNKAEVINVLNTDRRIVGSNIVDWDKYKKFQKEGER